VQVLWAGLASDYFVAQNGIKQGGVLSPILLCIYIDDLLIKLSLLGVGCFIGLNFTGAVAYADDTIVEDGLKYNLFSTILSLKTSTHIRGIARGGQHLIKTSK
jgi:arginine exporter protein ArgO